LGRKLGRTQNEKGCDDGKKNIPAAATIRTAGHLTMMAASFYTIELQNGDVAGLQWLGVLLEAITGDKLWTRP